MSHAPRCARPTLSRQPLLSALRARLKGETSSRGVSAVEFALIAPIMVLMLFGAAEASQAVTVDRKVTLAASTLGDLAAQTDSVSCADLAQIAAVTRTVFAPYPATNASLVVASIAMDGTAAKVEWSQVIDGTGGCTNVPNSHSLKVGSVVTVDSAMFAPGGGLVIGEVTLPYTTLGTSFMSNTVTMSERFYLRPRKSLKLCLDGVTVSGC